MEAVAIYKISGGETTTYIKNQPEKTVMCKGIIFERPGFLSIHSFIQQT